MPLTIPEQINKQRPNDLKNKFELSFARKINQTSFSKSFILYHKTTWKLSMSQFRIKIRPIKQTLNIAFLSHIKSILLTFPPLHTQSQ